MFKTKMEQNIPGQENVPTGIDSIVDNAAIAFIIKILGAIVVIIFLVMISKIIAGIVKRNIIKHSKEHNNPEHLNKVGKLIHDIVFYILVLFSVFVGFEMIGFDVGLILGGVSFGVGLAFKEILGNMIAGIMILYTKEFKLGDIIEISADQPYFGRIEEITIRYTIIRTLDLRQVVIPNMTLISVPVKTFSAEEMVKLNTTVGIHYDSDVNKAISTITNAINTLNFVIDKPNTTVFVVNFGDSSIDLKCIFGFNPNCGIIGDFAIGYVNEIIGQALSENGITIPYIHNTLTFENAEQKRKLLENLQENNKPTTQIEKPVQTQAPTQATTTSIDE